MNRFRIERLGTALQAAFPFDETPLQPLAASWECDLSNDALRWTPGVFDLFGIARGTAVDRADIVAMYAEESRALLERLRSDAIANKRSFTFEAQIRRADGALRWMRVTADVRCCSAGRVTHLHGLKQDITDEVELLRRLR